MKSEFPIIEQKLENFIRKFYTNKLVLGLLFFVVFGVVAFTVSSFAESFLYLSPLVKTFLFYSFIFILLSDFVFFILFPLLKIFKILPVISYEEASSIISNYFPESKDTLLNLIQLHYQQDSGDSELLLAAVNQKAGIISPLNFSSAINYKTTLRYLTVSLLLILVFSIFATTNFDRFKRGASQFLNYSAVYEPENPYHFSLLNTTLTTGRGEDFTLTATVDGPSVPNDVFINISGIAYRMNVDSTGFYSYTVRNVSSPINFNFTYLQYNTSDFLLNVYDKPSLNGFNVRIIPPAYTNLNSSDFENTGDLVVPRGSQISWNFDVLNVSTLKFFTDSVLTDTISVAQNQVSVKKSALKDFTYHYSVHSDNGLDSTFSPYNVTVVPDVYPAIEVVSSADSSSMNAMFFSGHISDDYGFHSLHFIYYDKSDPKNLHSETIEIVPTSINQDFFFYFDFSKFKSTVNYYFEVKDNDAVSGFKSTKTVLSSYNLLTAEEKEQRLSDLNNSLYDKIDQSQNLLHDITKDLEDFQKSVSGNNNLSDYEKQLKIDNLIEKQNKLKDLLKQISDDNFKKDLFQNQSQELSEKQKQMQNLWNELLNDDVKKLLDQINQLKDAINERNFRDRIDDLKFDFNQINEQLDRNNELLKYFSTEKKLNDLTQDLEKLSKEYDDFSRETLTPDSKNKDGKSNKDKLNKDKNNQKGSDNKDSDNLNNANQDSENTNDESLSPDDFKEKFETLKEKYEELMKQNAELDNLKLNIDSLFDKFDEISKQLDQQSDQFDKLQNPHDKSKSDNQKGDKDSQKGDKDSQMGDKDAQKNNQDNQKGDNNSQRGDKNNQKGDQQDSQNPDNRMNDNQNTGNQDQNNSNQDNQNPDNQSQSPQQQRQILLQQMQKTAEEMQQLAEQMNGQQKGQHNKKQAENLNDVRQILDNLVNISFSQENLINYTKSNQASAVYFQDLTKRQLSVRNDFALVRDSIYALAKREPELGHSVYAKIDEINSSITQSLSFISDNNKSRSAIQQQIILTNVNDLALIFAEIEQNMQQQMQSGQQGNDSEEAVESRNKKRAQQRQQQMQQAKQNQQNLIQTLQQMVQQMKEGNKPSSLQMAQSLRMQELLQQYLQELQQGSSTNPQTKQLYDQMQQLIEQNKRDIINRNITDNLLNRENQVFKKLLDLENAEKQQEFDEERESRSGNNFNNKTSEPNFPLNKQQGSKEFIFRNYLDIDLFYLNKYNMYMQKIK